MSEGPNIARIAMLIGDPARSEMLSALMGGQALTATELAGVAHVTKQTASAHLAKLVETRLVGVEAQGRHRYFRLADDDVARLLENLMGVAFRAGAVRLKSGPSEPALRSARMCYDHLAGEHGVQLLETLLARRLVRANGEGLTLTRAGSEFFDAFGIDLATLARSRRSLCRRCLDWSVRRHHLAGALGAAMLERMFALGWAKRARDSRVVLFSGAGMAALNRQFFADRKESHA